MKKISYVLAALATIAVAAPALAQEKPMMHRGMHHGMGMHRGMHHGMGRDRMMMHRHHHGMRHMMRREGM
jgi:hypothetical protein